MNKSTPKLVDISTNRVINVGDIVTTFRGETGILAGVKEPYDINEGQRGAKVYVEVNGQEHTNQWYPSVINAKFVIG